MVNCPYINKNGELCGNKMNGDCVICSKHKNRSQIGGGEISYSLDGSIGDAVLAMFSINNLYKKTIKSKK